MWGLFFEDINSAADGGLYAEMVQNRSFEKNGNDLLSIKIFKAESVNFSFFLSIYLYFFRKP